MSQFCCSRRELLNRLGGGIGSLALMDFLNQKGMAADRNKNPLAPKPQQIPAKAKAVISIFCYGGVSQVDTFDPQTRVAQAAG